MLLRPEDSEHPPQFFRLSNSSSRNPLLSFWTSLMPFYSLVLCVPLGFPDHCVTLGLFPGNSGSFISDVHSYLGMYTALH